MFQVKEAIWLPRYSFLSTVRTFFLIINDNHFLNSFWRNQINSYIIKSIVRLLWFFILITCIQGRIQSVSLGGGAISVIFGSQVSWRVHYCKRHEVYFTTLGWQNSGCQNGLLSRMLFSGLYKIMVKKVTFIGFSGRGWVMAPIALPPGSDTACIVCIILDSDHAFPRHHSKST